MFEASKTVVQVVDAQLGRRLGPTLRTERRSSVFCDEGLWSSKMSTQWHCLKTRRRWHRE